MNGWTIDQRARAYTATFPDRPPLLIAGGAKKDTTNRLEGVWVTGNDYRGSGYYGAYPPGYLARVGALFPDAERVLHLFSGSLPPGPYLRCDCQGEAEILGDAEEIDSLVGPLTFDLVLADPPYNEAEAAKYGTKMIGRATVLAAVHRILDPGGFLVWLDHVFPQYAKTDWHLRGLIGLVGSTNHKIRQVTIFEKRDIS